MHHSNVPVAHYNITQEGFDLVPAIHNNKTPINDLKWPRVDEACRS